MPPSFNVVVSLAIATAVVATARNGHHSAASSSRGNMRVANVGDWMRVVGVTTTILEVNDAVRALVAGEKLARLVVVGDIKTNNSEWRSFAREQHPKVEYLSFGDQLDLPYSMVKLVPSSHFGRKSIGFLHAIAQGATHIYDFDDDNHLHLPAFDVLSDLPVYDVDTTHHLYNPYPFFQPESGGAPVFVWPRGQPLQFIRDRETYSVPHRKSTLDPSQIAVVQSLADHDPDVDAVYRMTGPLPVGFSRADPALVVPPTGTFAPWNAQATLVSSAAFWSLLLPITVTGRVSDIWRSFIADRLLWEANYSVGFASPFVTQYRNPHSYEKDYIDERDLYEKGDTLLRILAGWRNTCASLDAAYIDLVSLLVREGILARGDLAVARAWRNDLEQLSYAWPEITQRQAIFVPRERANVDERTRSAAQRVAVCMSGSPRGAVTTKLTADLRKWPDALVIFRRSPPEVQHTFLRYVREKSPAPVDTIHHFLYPSLGRFDVFMALTAMAHTASTNQSDALAECAFYAPADTRNKLFCEFAQEHKVTPADLDVSLTDQLAAQKSFGGPSFDGLMGQMWDMARCSALIRRHENRTGEKYSTIVRLRPDAVFFSPVPVWGMGAQACNVFHGATDVFNVGPATVMHGFLQRVFDFGRIGRDDEPFRALLAKPHVPRVSRGWIAEQYTSAWLNHTCGHGLPHIYGTAEVSRMHVWRYGHSNNVQSLDRLTPLTPENTPPNMNVVETLEAAEVSAWAVGRITHR